MQMITSRCTLCSADQGSRTNGVQAVRGRKQQLADLIKGTVPLSAPADDAGLADTFS